MILNAPDPDSKRFQKIARKQKINKKMIYWTFLQKKKQLHIYFYYLKIKNKTAFLILHYLFEQNSSVFWHKTIFFKQKSNVQSKSNLCDE